jgi:UDPglucose--hexose-1-phosphate uridylyltransferase
MDIETSHRRWNPLKREWVLVSPHRTKRPWKGAVEKPSVEKRPEYDPTCYLCPGNTRANGEVNPHYPDVFAFTNDFAAVTPDASTGSMDDQNGIILAKGERGTCRVICFSPRHDLTLPEMDVRAIRRVIDLWEEETRTLSQLDYVNHVMIFENKGAIMGCSNPHPHSQIWATESLPNIPASSLAAQEEYYAAHKKRLLEDYLDWELIQGTRIVAENNHWLVVVPFWACWPFETMALPKRHVREISELTDEEKNSWAAILKELTVRYDNLFTTSFPYSMGIYQRPTDGKEWNGHYLHQIFLPPLLRSASVKKFMVGFELCAEPQRDLTPEQAAERLRNCPTKHYKE